MGLFSDSGDPVRSKRLSLYAGMLALSTVALGCSDGGGTTDADVDGVIAVFDCDDTNPAVGLQVTYFRDVDRDGVGGSQSSLWCAASAPSGYAATTGDCDDDERGIQDPIVYHVDADGDGAGSAPTEALCALVPPAGYAAAEDDCNDADATVQGVVDYFVDLDQDGSGRSLVASLCEGIAPLGYSDDDADCNDDDPSVTRPVDYFPDADGDGFGAGVPTASCQSTPPAGFSSTASDPDDSAPARTPEDRDGDGVANALDCEPDDAARWALGDYFFDYDRDGLGAEAVQLCEAVPPPPVDRHAFVGGDDCPFSGNWDQDWDEDGLDDSCDTLIHIQQDETIEVEFLRLAEYAVPASSPNRTSREYRVGSEGNPVEVTFRSRHGSFESCSQLRVQGGSKVTFESDRDRHALLVMSGADAACETRLEGVASVDPDARNEIAFRGIWLDIEEYVRFDGLHAIVFEPLATVDANAQPIEVPSTITTGDRSYPSRFPFQIAAEYPTVSNSPSAGGALIVRDQYLSLFGWRFIDNAGYPVECVGGTFRLSSGLPGGAPRERTACQSAVTRAYFEGNGRAGPLVDVYDSRDESPSGGTPIWRREGTPKPFDDWGTDTLYVKRLEVLDGAYAQMTGMTVLPWTRPDPDHTGPGPAPDAIHPDAEIATGDRGQLFVERGADLRAIPIRLGGGSTLLVMSDGRVGPVIAEHRGVAPVGPGAYVQFGSFNTSPRTPGILDPTTGPFFVEVTDPADETLPARRVGLFLQGENGFDIGHINLLGSLWPDKTTIRTDASFDVPILAVGTPRNPPDYDSPLDVDSEITVEGATLDDLFEVEEDGCCLEARFVLESP